jgi:hypothetical protein
MPPQYKLWGQNKPPLGWQPLASAVADLGIVAAWLMNEGGGTLNFDLLNSTIATQTGGISWTIGLGTGIGNSPVPTGPALIYNGTTGYSSFSDAHLPSGASPFTIACTVNLVAKAGAGGGEICSWGRPGNATGAANGQQTVFGWTGAAPSNLFLSNYGSQITSTNNFTAGDWFRMVLTYDGANGLFYFNGTQDSAAQALTMNTVLFHGTFGCRWDGDNGQTEFSNTIINNIIIANKSWTPEQIMYDTINPFWWMQPLSRKTYPMPASTFRPPIAAYVRQSVRRMVPIGGSR